MSVNPADVRYALERLKPSETKALLTRDGAGSYSKSCFERLWAKNLVDSNFYWTPLGCAVRAFLGAKD